MNVSDKRKSPSGLSPGSGSPSGLAVGAIPLGKKNCTTDPVKSQSTTCGGTEDLDKYTSKKQRTFTLADSYERLGYETKSQRTRNCGSFLSFAREVRPGLEMSKARLYWANFCKDRLCPMCSWRRSVKLFQNLARIIDVTGTDYTYLLFTLTVPNVPGDELRLAIDELLNGFKLFMKYKEISRICLGWSRTLEVTRNRVKNTYHPHIHVLAAVPKGYLKSHYYLSHKRILELWQRAMKDDSIKFVNVKLVKDFHGELADDNKKLIGAVKEVSKYTVKDSDYLDTPNDWELTDEVVQTLSTALRGRRLHALGGVFKEIARTLELQDPETDEVDLTDCDRLNPLGDWLITKMHWNGMGYSETDVELLDYDTRKKLRKKGLN